MKVHFLRGAFLNEIKYKSLIKAAVLVRIRGAAGFLCFKSGAIVLF